MEIKLKKHHLNKFSLNVLSLLFGYTFWIIISSYQQTNISFDVPISFYNTKNIVIDSPQSVSLTVLTKREMLYKKSKDIAVHINANQLKEGKNKIHLTQSHLFLPDGLEMVNYNPSSIIVTIS